MRVVATAGHVDHGKSTLVRALTGVDPDRLPEEQTRGLTIDLGFAAATLPSGAEVGFVDVPGHARYVGNMLAGVGSVDACLFVVAATEGWKEQSEEHLRILGLLGLSHGLVALTKVAATEDGWPELMALEVRDRLAGTFLADAPIVEVDVPAGIGLDGLRVALDRLLAATPPAADHDRPRLWVDRSFAVQGSGTVVTGTLRDGSLAVGMEMAVLPGGRAVRVRSLQSHHHKLEHATPGRRLAVNLTGASRHEVGRGQALVRPGQWHATSCFDARLTVLPTLGHAVERRGAYAVYTGSGQYPVRMRVLGRGRIDAGQEGLARFWIKNPEGLPLLPGDRYVLRESGRFETVGGGEVLDVEPVRPAKHARPDRSVERVVAERGWVERDHLRLITGVQVEADVGRWVVDPAILAAERADLAARVTAAGTAGLDLSTLDDRRRALLDRLDGVGFRDGRAVDAAALGGPAVSEAASRVLAVLEAAGCSPPTLPLSDRGALRELQRAGLAVEAGEVWFAASAVEAAVGRLAKVMTDHPEGFTVADARDALGSSRRSVVPLLSHLDSIGVTRRRGDLRTPGPRLARYSGTGAG
ncbi:MAG: selenocysteine-specific translation elongation factor [Actinomycetota bacterium]|nr:selenocysteine-specific translation elongation factor [Actinomycetota bacterium]